MPDFEHGAWSVHLSESKEFRQEKWDVVFRRTARMGKECEKFTLMVEDNDDAFLILYLFDDGKFSFEVYAPSLIQKTERKKAIFIGVFDRSSWERVP